MSDPSDKRRHHRFQALLNTRVLPGEHIPADLSIATVDVAVGGVRCVSNMPLPERTRLQMVVTLVGGDLAQPRAIEVEAIVLRCAEKPGSPPNRRYQLALEFVRMDPEHKRVLQSYLNSL